jgi:hypothetical protein
MCDNIRGSDFPLVLVALIGCVTTVLKYKFAKTFILTIFSLIEAPGPSASAEGRLYCILHEKCCILFFEASKYLHFKESYDQFKGQC